MNYSTIARALELKIERQRKALKESEEHLEAVRQLQKQQDIERGTPNKK